MRIMPIAVGVVLLPVWVVVATIPLPAAVWPPPLSVSCSGGPGPAIDSKLKFVLTGAGASSDITTGATARYLPLLTQHTAHGSGINTIAINVGGDSMLGQATDYSYSITADGTDTVNVTAKSPFGVAYALETFSQFITPEHGTVACNALQVTDSPAFVHRGVMIDTGRRFYPVALVKQTIDGLAMTKQNILHFHLSEECFRVQSKAYPQLTQTPCVVGSNNNTAFYTHEDVADIVSYARARGVRVVPEFDMPGHSGGFCKALATAGLKCCGNQIEDDPEGVSVKIISTVLTEMAGLFPDEILNIGCDETGSRAPCTTENTKSLTLTLTPTLTLTLTLTLALTPDP